MPGATWCSRSVNNLKMLFGIFTNMCIRSLWLYGDQASGDNERCPRGCQIPWKLVKILTSVAKQLIIISTYLKIVLIQVRYNITIFTAFQNIFPRLSTHVTLKSSKWLNALVLFSLITSEIFPLTYRYRYQFVGEVMTDMWSIKERIQCASLGIPKGMKNAIYIFIAFCLDFLIRNENTPSEECKTKSRLK